MTCQTKKGAVPNRRCSASSVGPGTSPSLPDSSSSDSASSSHSDPLERSRSSPLRGVIHFVVGGVLIFWPEVTALVIAVLIGIDLILDGVLAFVVRSRMPDDWPGRGGLLFRGGVDVILGIVVLVWPGQTLVVITYLLAVYLIVLGLVLLWGAKRLADAKKREAAGAT
ncbi:MAG: hypothetical protein DYH08_00905 [Actinobacteria bacterium ATB1]|nr:hypothetical protein [Actinobacteria bacterium ATB1]